MRGLAGDDRFVVTIGDGNDDYIGGAGVDTYDLSTTTAAATVNLANGTATSAQTGNDNLSSIENVIGSQGNNTITGNGSANVFDGGGGADTINAAGGADRIIGGIGNDIMTGGNGSDTFVFVPGFGNDKSLISMPIRPADRTSSIFRHSGLRAPILLRGSRSSISVPIR